VIDLSKDGTSNCYIVPEAGTYKFKTVKGNSTTSVGTISSVAVLWESFGTGTMPNTGDLIKANITYSDGYITFSTNESYRKGNASIAAKDASGNILWSWHLWLTEKLGDQTYSTHGTMMDRNLGATSATKGAAGALGLLYQWGRKDPFMGSSSISVSNDIEDKHAYIAKATGTWDSTKSIGMTPELSIKNPTTFYREYDYNRVDDFKIMWGSTKTIYDPCPIGYRLPDGGSNGFWSNFSFVETGDMYYEANWDFDTESKGADFGSYFESDSYWYPASGCRKSVSSDIGFSYDVGLIGYYWSCTAYSNSGSGNAFYFEDYSIQGQQKTAYVHGNYPLEYEWAASVRCLKE